MGHASYRVILTGNILENFTVTQVVTSAATLFKCGPDQAKKFFNGKPTALKKPMDQDTANRYCQRLAQAGIASRIELITDATGKAAFTATTPRATQTPSPGSSPTAPQATPQKTPTTAAAHKQNSPDARKEETIRRLIDDDSTMALVDDSPPEDTNSQQALAGSEPGREATNPAAVNGESLFKCPKCTTPQQKGKECIKCGIIFAKYQTPDPLQHQQQPQIAAGDDAGDVDEEADEWEEITLFVGDNVEPYRHKFHELYHNNDNYLLQWHWPAFFAPIPWLIYRKMYILALGYIALMAASSLSPIFLLPLTIAPGLLGNFIYYRYITNHLNNIMTTGEQRKEDIIAAGNTNSMLITIGITVLSSVLLGVIYYMIYLKPVMEDAVRMATADMQEIRSVKNPGDQQTRVKMLLLKSAIVMQRKVSIASDTHFIMPDNMDEMQSVLHLPDNSIKDAWNTRMKFSVEDNSMIFISAGPDHEFETSDDITYKADNE